MTLLSNRERAPAREPASFRRENEIAVFVLLRVFCETIVVAKTSPQNVGDLVCLESQKGSAIIIQLKLLR